MTIVTNYSNTNTKLNYKLLSLLSLSPATTCSRLAYNVHKTWAENNWPTCCLSNDLFIVYYSALFPSHTHTRTHTHAFTREAKLERVEHWALSRSMPQTAGGDITSLATRYRNIAWFARVQTIMELSMTSLVFHTYPDSRQRHLARYLDNNNISE